MEKVLSPPLSTVVKTYLALTKPGIIAGNSITAVGGFILASKGSVNPWLLLATLTGLSLVIASACVFNNCIDRQADGKMARTKDRPLVKGLVTPKQAMLFGATLGLIGILFLTFYTNLLTAFIALIGFFVYVLLYSFSKYHSTHSTLIGSIAGAVPPVVGYTAVNNQLDLAALILFAMIVLWQMPHFYAIAINRSGDYAAADIPTLPLKKGMQTTKIHMLLYTAAFTLVSCLLSVFGYLGYAYLTAAISIGTAWVLLSIKGFKATDDKAWARKMFLFSLIAVTALCFVIPFSVTS